MRVIITIRFDSAKLCFGEKDYVFDIKHPKYINRKEHDLAKNTILPFPNKDIEAYEHLIRMEQVSNMLHVLSGCRPVPTYRYTLRKRIKEIDELAINSWYKLDCQPFYETKNGKYLFLEFTQGKKWIKNANRPDLRTVSSNGIVFEAYVTWGELYRKYYFSDNEKYNLILSKFKEWYGKDSFKVDYSLVDFILKLSEDPKIKSEIIEFSKQIQCNDLALVAQKITKGLSFNHISGDDSTNFNLARKSINVNVVKKITLNGYIKVPIDNNTNLFKEIVNGVRCANFLDGGIASIVGIDPDTSDDLDESLKNNDYQKVFYQP